MFPSIAVDIQVPPPLVYELFVVLLLSYKAWKAAVAQCE